MTRTGTLLLVLLTALPAASCDDPVAPDLALSLDQASSALTATVVVSNVGSAPMGPIALAVTAVRFGEEPLADPVIRVSPTSIPSLPAGGSRQVQIVLDSASLIGHGTYTARFQATAAGRVFDLTIPFEAAPDGVPAASLSLQVPDAVVRGEAFTLAVEARDESGALIEDPALGIRIEPASAGLVRDRRVVAYEVGSLTIVVYSGSVQVTETVSVAPRPAGAVAFTTVGTGTVEERYTSDLWVHGSYAYTGTWGVRSQGGVSTPGNALKAWDISDPSAPQLTATVLVDARTVNDVKVSADGSLAVLTHEGSTDGANGITLLDLTDPAVPTTITRYTTGLSPGVHNVWIELPHVYVVVDGGAGLRVLDISDPSAPVEVARYSAGESFLHDVYVRDGLAFLSHWNAGLVILDVGNGIAGGSPGSPAVVSRIETEGGETHNAWYWPEAGYVFVGEEDFGRPGLMHVVDVRDLTAPVEVATFRVEGGSPPHNFWLDEVRGILYAAWYEHGVRAIDVTGDLMGELDRQGRELGASTYAGFAAGGCRSGPATCTWAPQLAGGLLYVSDMNTGLWVLRPEHE